MRLTGNHHFKPVTITHQQIIHGIFNKSKTFQDFIYPSFKYLHILIRYGFIKTK